MRASASPRADAPVRAPTSSRDPHPEWPREDAPVATNEAESPLREDLRPRAHANHARSPHQKEAHALCALRQALPGAGLRLARSCTRRAAADLLLARRRVVAPVDVHQDGSVRHRSPPWAGGRDRERRKSDQGGGGDDEVDALRLSSHSSRVTFGSVTLRQGVYEDGNGAAQSSASWRS